MNLVLDNDDINNTQVLPKNDAVYFRVVPTKAMDMTLVDNATKPIIRNITPFLYYGNTTIQPLTLPPPNVDMNLIPDSVRYFGISMATIVMGLSVAFPNEVFRSRRRVHDGVDLALAQAELAIGFKLRVIRSCGLARKINSRPYTNI